MTHEKALEILKYSYPNGNGIAVEEVQDTFDLAIEALEKQIPKNPKEELYDISGRPLKNKSDIHTRENYACPNCGVSQTRFIPYTYCAKCGQKIDWEAYSSDRADVEKITAEQE